MSFLRVIPILLLRDSGLVKTINFKKSTYIGDPINAVKIFNQKEVDELVLLDIDASVENYEPNFDWIEDIVSESFMPIGYGGGIKNISHVKRIFELGVEKVIINSALRDFDLLSEAISIYGSQSIVACIDVKKSLFGKQYCYLKSGKEKIKLDVVEWAIQLEKIGVGEIIIQSIDFEGKMSGYDIDTIKKVSESVNIPVVASGGAGSLSDMKDVFNLTKATAAAAGSIFVYKGPQRGVLINYPNREELDNLNN
ncbi:MAG: AglZ/HisF2 family acetamidino modification protein [Bacteroidota bacterium]|nr:AglZ/HisF2 family acetamidino modification protein [Bacteroidota bacterium]